MAIVRTITSITGKKQDGKTDISITNTAAAALTFPATGLSVRDGTKFQVIDITLNGTNADLVTESIVDIEWTEGGNPNKAIKGLVTNDGNGTIEITGLALTGKFKFQFFGLLEIDDPKLTAATKAAGVTDEDRNGNEAKGTIANKLVDNKTKQAIIDELKKLNSGTALAADAITAGNAKVMQLAQKILAPPAATFSVSIGNMNTEDDWIIDFSAEQATGKKSSVNVGALIEWIKSKNSDIGAGVEPKLPAGEGMALTKKDPATGTESKVDLKEIKEYVITFEDFWFNITKKIFKIDVRSGADQELNIGAFTIKKIGFTLTNQPPPGKYASLASTATAALTAAADKE